DRGGQVAGRGGVEAARGRLFPGRLGQCTRRHRTVAAGDRRRAGGRRVQAGGLALGTGGGGVLVHGDARGADGGRVVTFGKCTGPGGERLLAGHRGRALTAGLEEPAGLAGHVRDRLQLGEVHRVGRLGARGHVGDLPFVADIAHRDAVLALRQRVRTQRDAVV